MFKKDQQPQRDLFESERNFRLLVEGVADYALYMLDPDGVVTSWNSGGQRIKGYSGKFDPSVDRYLNPAAFTTPPNFSFGTAPIALPGVRTQARNDESVTLQKRTRIKERVSFTLRGEFFNLFNRVTFSQPAWNQLNVADPASFAIATSTTYPPRHIQLGAKVEF